MTQEEFMQRLQEMIAETKRANPCFCMDDCDCIARQEGEKSFAEDIEYLIGQLDSPKEEE